MVPIVNSDHGYFPLSSAEALALGEDAIPEHWAAQVLAKSTVRLPAWFGRFESVFDRTITQLEQDTPVGWSQSYLLKGQVALRLNDEYETELAGHWLRYSRKLGLQIGSTTHTQKDNE